MIRDENGMLAGYVYVDLVGKDVGGYVTQAKKAVPGNYNCRRAIRCNGAASLKICCGSRSVSKS